MRALGIGAARVSLAWFAVCSHAAAQDIAPPPEPPQREIVLEGDQGFATALRILLEAQQYDAALSLLDTRTDLAERADVIRLRAQLLVLTGKEREAMALLESHLTRDSHDALARFQLAELHFAGERYGAATLAYQLALAGDLDAMRTTVSRARLSQISERRVWRVWAGASAAPDSNINSATDASRVDLFGLPFELDDDARRRSGISLSAFGGVERRFSRPDGGGFVVGLAASGMDAPGTDFDDIFLSLRAGPQWRIGAGGEVAVEATASHRWYGGDPLETGLGVQARTEFSVSDTTRWRLAGRVETIDAVEADSRDGELYGVDVARTRFLGPSALWRASSSLNYRDAQSETESFVVGRVAVGRLFPLPFSSLIYAEPYVSARRYDAESITFGAQREDFEYGLSARVSKRDWILFGAFPFVSVSASNNDSNIDLFDFSRERVEFGFTREF